MKTVLALLFAAVLSRAVGNVAEVRMEIWHGDRQRVGHGGIAQDDFNVMGHIERWQDIDTLAWSLNRRSATPLSFRAFRRLARDGDFNADVPIASLKPGENTVTITARLRNGAEVSRSVVLVREQGVATLPVHVAWADGSEPQDIGQYVDGKWRVTEAGLRTVETGYDRLFVIGDRSWQDCDVRTTLTVHAVARTTDRLSGAPGCGIIWRFAGHVVGGPRAFPAAQPKWGYQPFGAIGWLRWTRGADQPPSLEFYSGDSDRTHGFGTRDVSLGTAYAVRLRCETLPDDGGAGVTRYSFRIWPEGTPEPSDWTWRHRQTSRDALRRGALALVAHHVDATFGACTIAPIAGPEE